MAWLSEHQGNACRPSVVLILDIYQSRVSIQPHTVFQERRGREEFILAEVENLFDKAVGEIERMLNTKTVVGEPIVVEGNTLIPLVNVGFGFGVGTGQGTDPKKGGGTGGGGGVKPVALVIINEAGVQVEPIKSSTASVIEKIAETVARGATDKARQQSES